MPQYQYRVIPAPSRGLKAKGVKTAEDRFSHALEDTLNTMAAEGWAYQRAETLPSVERAGLTSTTTQWRNVLVFRKEIPPPVVEPEPEQTPEPPIINAPPVPAEPVTQGPPDPARLAGTLKRDPNSDDTTP